MEPLIGYVYRITWKVTLIVRVATIRMYYYDIYHHNDDIKKARDGRNPQPYHYSTDRKLGVERGWKLLYTFHFTSTWTPSTKIIYLKWKHKVDLLALKRRYKIEYDSTKRAYQAELQHEREKKKKRKLHSSSSSSSCHQQEEEK